MRKAILSSLTGLILATITLATFYRATGPVGARSQAEPLAVVINEIAWMGTTTSANDEWIELANTGAVPVDLTGWTLTAVDGTPNILLNGTIPPGGSFLMERTDDSTVPGVSADMLYAGSMGNGGEHLILRDALSATIDSIDSSLGWFAGHADGRVPMVRIDQAVSGDLATNWRHNPRCGSPTNGAGVTHSCVLTVTNVGQALDYAVYFNDRATTATTTTLDPTEMETALLGYIDQATTTVDVSLYGLNRQSVTDALIAAHGRGVAVRVVGDDEAATVDYSASYAALSQAGIGVITDTGNSKIQHNKFLVVDGTTVWTGSTNFTDTGLTLNANNSLVVTDTTLAAIYSTEFEEMWSGLFHEDKGDNTAHLLDFNGTLVESYFSPTDLVAFEVWDELAQAEESVHVAMFFWTDKLLGARVLERLATGVEVTAIWDLLGAASPTSVDELLCAGGAQVGIEDFAGKLHHKFAVIDVNGSDPVVVLGSYNWTAAGAYDNDENTLIIHDAVLAQAYFAEWQSLWDALHPSDICQPNRRYVPAVVKP